MASGEFTPLYVPLTRTDLVDVDELLLAVTTALEIEKPETGDTTSTGIYVAIMLGMLGLGYVLLKKKKEKPPRGGFSRKIISFSSSAWERGYGRHGPRRRQRRRGGRAALGRTPAARQTPQYPQPRSQERG